MAEVSQKFLNSMKIDKKIIVVSILYFLIFSDLLSLQIFFGQLINDFHTIEQFLPIPSLLL